MGNSKISGKRQNIFAQNLILRGGEGQRPLGPTLRCCNNDNLFRGVHDFTTYENIKNVEMHEVILKHTASCVCRNPCGLQMKRAAEVVSFGSRVGKEGGSAPVQGLTEERVPTWL